MPGLDEANLAFSGLKFGADMYMADRAAEEARQKELYEKAMARQQNSQTLGIFNRNFAQNQNSETSSQGLAGLNYLSGQNENAQKLARMRSFRQMLLS